MSFEARPALTVVHHSGRSDDDESDSELDGVRPQVHTLFRDHGFGTFTAYIPYVLAYKWSRDNHPDAPMNPCGAWYMNDWLDLGLLVPTGRNTRGTLDYTYHYWDDVYEVGSSWDAGFGSEADFRGQMTRVMGALAARPCVTLVDSCFDFATAQPEQAHTVCDVWPDRASIAFTFKDATGVPSRETIERPTLQEACAELACRWDALEADGATVLRVALPCGGDT